MAFVIEVREVGEDLDPEEHGLHCALPSVSVPDDVVREERDGVSDRVAEFSRVAVTNKGEKNAVIDAGDIAGRLMVTDARVAIACTTPLPSVPL